ncbi:hypothetical protein [Nannocystis sp.]|uniref:hypothetical protein n=1 Tax=Nannocystis sp. TaxID=1962667 RepID=UPI0025EB3748|nr:hypothetical protein [Nannocystis sp.]
MKAKSLEVIDLNAKLRAERQLLDAAGAVPVDGTRTEAKKLDSKITAEVSVGSIKGKGIVYGGKSQLDAYEARIAELTAEVEASEATDADRTLLAELEAEVGLIRTNVTRRDALELIPTAERKEGDKDELAALSRKLEPWLRKAEDTSLDEVSVTGEAGKAALVARIDVSTGKMAMTIGTAEVKGVERGDLLLDSAKASGLTVNADVGTDLRMGTDLMKSLTTAGASVDALEFKGLKMGGEALSQTLEEELEALALKARLNAADMSASDTRRRGELPALIARVRGDEGRLAELRRTQKTESASFTPAMEAELTSLADRVDPQVTNVASVEMNHASVKLDTKAGRIEIGAGQEGGEAAVKIDGIEIGQLQPDGSVKITTKIDAVGVATVSKTVATYGGLDKLIDPTKSEGLAANFAILGVELEGFERRAKSHSAILQGEADALADMARTSELAELDQKRLAELPGLISQAHRDEARLVELRRTQEQTPDNFGSELQMELKALAKRLDPAYRKVQKVGVHQLDVGVDTRTGRVEVGIAKEDSGKPGLEFGGVEFGQIGPDGTLVAEKTVAAMKLETAQVGLTTDAGMSAIFDPTKSETFRVEMQGSGLEVSGVEQGKAGEPGHLKLDKMGLDWMSSSYDKADGGEASLALQGAKLEGLEMGSTKLATLEARMGELLASSTAGRR